MPFGVLLALTFGHLLLCNMHDINQDYLKTLPLILLMEVTSTTGCKIIAIFITPYRYQTIPELVTRLNSLQQEYRNVVKYCQRLKEKIALSCEADGMQVDDGIHTDLKVLTLNIITVHDPI